MLRKMEDSGVIHVEAASGRKVMKELREIASTFPWMALKRKMNKTHQGPASALMNLLPILPSFLRNSKPQYPVSGD